MSGSNKSETKEKTVMDAIFEDTPRELLVEYWGTKIVPDNTIFPMKTKNQEGTPLFLIHAMDVSMNTLAEKLNRPAWGLQCTKDAPLETIENLANHFVNAIKSVKASGPYILIGYSFGACVAVEMGFIFEKEGTSVQLFLIDGSPEFVKNNFSGIHTKELADREESKDENPSLNRLKKAMAYFAKLLNPNLSIVEVIEIDIISRVKKYCKCSIIVCIF